MRIALIDNYDSFTYNLFQQVASLGAHVDVFKCDEITVKHIRQQNYAGIILSPGPKRPEDSGVCKDVVKECMRVTPILGVCLGHQIIGMVFGTQTVHAPTPVHGKTSYIFHDDSVLFRNVSNPFIAARYHSLMLNDVPKNCVKTAWNDEGIIMGIQHRTHPLFGIQFHPESFLTSEGTQIMKNFLNIL